MVNSTTIDVRKIGIREALRDINHTIEKDNYILSNLARRDNYEAFMMHIRLHEMTAMQLFIMSYKKDFDEEVAMIEQLEKAHQSILGLLNQIKAAAKKQGEDENEIPCTAE